MASASIAYEAEILPREMVTWLDRMLRRVLDHLGVGGECRVRLVSDGDMAASHEKHLGVPGTTDVITFDLSDPSDAGGSPFLDVDLLVCVDEAKRQALIGKVPVEHELMLYIVHGILHCLGHDDHDEDRARIMHAQEDEILTAVGIGAVYRRSASHPGGAGA